jgi:hypothetical protein
MRLRFAIAGTLRGKVPRAKEDTGTGRRLSPRRGADVQRSRPGGCRRPADYTEISAAGPRAAWGLGTTGQSSYVAHWNGKRWTRMPVPPHLYGVAISGLSTSDVWLAGWLSGTDNRQSLVYRWNGHSWIRMLRGVDLGSVIAIRPADVFVQLGSGRLLRWNGITWTAYPNPYGRGKLAAVGTQLWRIENATVDRRPNRLIVQRWTGLAWRTMTSPHPVVVADADLSASSPRNVLVEIMNVRRQDARLLRWNARVWSRAELSLRLAGEPPRCGRRRHRQRLDRCRHCPVVGWQVAGC